MISTLFIFRCLESVIHPNQMIILDNIRYSGNYWDLKKMSPLSSRWWIYQLEKATPSANPSIWVHHIGSDGKQKIFEIP